MKILGRQKISSKKYRMGEVGTSHNKAKVGVGRYFLKKYGLFD